MGYKAFQELVEASFDITAMACKDLKIIPKDDYTNIDLLFEKKIIDSSLKNALYESNGLRNRLVHRYNQLNDAMAFDSIESLKKDFSFLFGSDDIRAILLYGSAEAGDETPRSDIDICIVLPSRKHMKDILNEIYRKLDVFTKKYDVRFFEELPLYIQINIIESNKIIYSKDVYELYEYFYFIRKLWNDQMMRQQVTAAEMIEILG